MNVPARVGQRATAEGIGTALLLAAVVGSGIMAERLAAGNVALALLANALATAAALFALIVTFGPISGAHFNPVVSLAELREGRLSPHDCVVYIAAQVVGALSGVLLAHAMFGLPLLMLSTHARAGVAQGASEVVATFGLLCVILSGVRFRSTALPSAVAAYIGGAYWFTASTSFANPAVTLARAFTDTFAGIRAIDVPAFVVAQLVGATLAIGLFRWMSRAAAVSGG